MSNYQSRRPAKAGRSNSNRNFKSAPKKSRIKKAYIHPSKFIQSAQKKTEENQYSPTHTFADFNIDELIKRNLNKMGLVSPSAIQDQTIPLGLEGKDVVGIANTGTGKTAAFAIPMLNKLMNDRSNRAIVLAPTRELAEQIERQCRDIAKGSGLSGALLIGGVPIGPQLRNLSQRPNVIIGTPGRVKDHMERGSLDIKNFTMVVLDEVDRMLDMGFVHDIRHILSHIEGTRQSLYFSATLDNKVKEIIHSFSVDPVHVSVKSNETSLNVEQSVVNYKRLEEKIDRLHDILIHNATVKTVIFDDTQRSVERLSKELAARGFTTDAIHGGKSQSQRQRVLKRFKSSDIDILVATDVAARGLDIPDITHVINFSTPQTYDDYVHRIGRTGRADKTGFALTFIQD